MQRQFPVTFEEMFLPLLLFPGAWAITYDEMKEYNCYTLRGRYSRNEMICGAAIEEDKQCEEMCRTRDTVARLFPNPPRDFTVATGEHLCEIKFTGRCATAAFGRDSSDLCLTIGRRDLPYNDAIRDCEKNGGSLYVPDSDYELNRLIELIDGEIDRFWLGGGSIFFRTCRDASQGKTEEVAVMYMITERDKRFLGYSTTRITSERAPYICATRNRRGNKDSSCLGAVVEAPTEPTVAAIPTTSSTQPPPPPPPRCALKVSHTGGGATAIVTCFNDGALKLGDKLIFSGTTPKCCPGVGGQDSVWSFNLYSRNQAPWLHAVIKNGWKNMILTTGPNGWGAMWGGRSIACPFRPESPFTIEITNNQNALDMILNGQSFSYDHPFAGDRNDQYFYLAFVIYSKLTLTDIAVVRNGIRDEIGLGVTA